MNDTIIKLDRAKLLIDNNEKDVIIIWQFWDEFPGQEECIHIPREKLSEFVGGLEQCRKEK